MAIYQLKTFSDIYTYVLSELKVQSGDTTSLNRIKRLVNAIYLDEVVPYEKWEWLHGSVDLTLDSKVTTGTVSVTQNSVTAVFSSAPTDSVKNYLFAPNSHNEVYRVSRHTASATSFDISSIFTGSTDADDSYNLWQDRIALPSDCREVTSVSHDYDGEPCERLGLSKLKKHFTIFPGLEGRPRWYAMGDWVDPAPFDAIAGFGSGLSTRASAGLVRTCVFTGTVAALIYAGDRIEVTAADHEAFNGQFIVSSVTSATITYTGTQLQDNSATADTNIIFRVQGVETQLERYRELLLYPTKLDKKTTLHVDYIKEALPLEDDDDEPIIPLGDRIILAYGTLMHAWRSIGRNPEEAATNLQLYDRKLSKMQGKTDSNNELPTLVPERSYITSKRNIRRVRSSDWSSFGGSNMGGGGSAQVVKGTANKAAYFDSDGELGSYTADADNLVIISATQTLTNKTLSLPIVTPATDSQMSAVGEIWPDSGSNNVFFYHDGTQALRVAPIVSVKEFGAVGDGTTDDAAAFESAFSAGGNLFVPAGTYLIKSNIDIVSGNFRLFGEGSSSILKAATTAVTRLISMPGVSDVIFEDLAFYGAKSAAGTISCIGLLIGASGNGSSRVQVRGCRFDGPSAGLGFNIGIDLLESTDCVVENCYFANIMGTSSGYGYGIIAPGGSDRSRFIGNDFNFVQGGTYGGRHCIYLGNGTSDCSVIGNNGVYCSDVFWVAYSKKSQSTGYRNTFIGNTANLGNNHGLALSVNSEGNTVVGNSFYDIAADGIRAESSASTQTNSHPRYNTISGNTIEKCGNYGILIHGGNDNNISGNVIVDWGQSSNTHDGIAITDNSDVGNGGLRNHITGNHLRVATGSARSGIRMTTSTEDTYVDGNSIDPANLDYTINDLAVESAKNPGNSPYTQGVVQATSDYTLTAKHSGGICTNSAVTQTMTYTLPAAAVGLRFTFYLTAGQELRVQPAGTELFQGYTTTAGEYISSSRQGDSITIVARSTSRWMIESEMGGWDNETSASVRNIQSDTINLIGAVGVTGTMGVTGAFSATGAVNCGASATFAGDLSVTRAAGTATVAMTLANTSTQSNSPAVMTIQTAGDGNSDAWIKCVTPLNTWSMGADHATSDFILCDGATLTGTIKFSISNAANASFAQSLYVGTGGGSAVPLSIRRLGGSSAVGLDIQNDDQTWWIGQSSGEDLQVRVTSSAGSMALSISNTTLDVSLPGGALDIAGSCTVAGPMSVSAISAASLNTSGNISAAGTLAVGGVATLSAANAYTFSATGNIQTGAEVITTAGNSSATGPVPMRLTALASGPANVSATETTALSYTVGEGMLVTRADQIKIKGGILCAGNTQVKTLKVSYDGDNLLTHTTDTSSAVGIFEVNIFRGSSGAAYYDSYARSSDDSDTNVNVSTHTVSHSASNVLLITIQGNASNDIKLYGTSIDYLPI